MDFSLSALFLRLLAALPFPFFPADLLLESLELEEVVLVLELDEELLNSATGSGLATAALVSALAGTASACAGAGSVVVTVGVACTVTVAGSAVAAAATTAGAAASFSAGATVGASAPSMRSALLSVFFFRNPRLHPHCRSCPLLTPVCLLWSYLHHQVVWTLARESCP